MVGLFSRSPFGESQGLYAGLGVFIFYLENNFCDSQGKCDMKMRQSSTIYKQVEPHHEENKFLPMRKQKCRSAPLISIHR